MKTNKKQMAVLGMALAAFALGWAGSVRAASEASQMMNSYEAEQKAEAKAREKDSDWKPSCNEVAPIQVGSSKRAGAVKNFCQNTDGNLLVCYAGKEVGKNESSLRVYSPKGELLKTMPLEIAPGAVAVAKDGSIFVGGDGRIQKLDAQGKVLASADSPVAKAAININKETEEMVKAMAKQTKRPYDQELAQMKKNLEKRRAEVTGLTVTDGDVFMAVPSPSDFSFQVYRFDLALGNSKVVVDKLHGCCGQMDVQSHDGKLWIPHNAKHTVEARDRDGKELTKFGKAGRVKATDFGGCCEPKNLRVLPNGDILAANRARRPASSASPQMESSKKSSRW